jgi:hypothetical protein
LIFKNNKTLFYKKEKLKECFNKKTVILDINLNKKVDLNKIKNKDYESIILNISDNCNLLDNNQKSKLIKKIIKSGKIIRKKRVKLGVLFENKMFIANMEYKINDIENNEILIALKAISYTDLVKKYVFLYGKMCNYLDNKFCSNNYCDFKDDICIEKRGTNATMGCCHYFKHKYTGIFRKNDLVLCRYQKNRSCIAECITCKMFTCDTLQKNNIKFTLNNVVLIKEFFNPFQKLIIKFSFFTHKKIILKRLLLLA